jgi:hypothetical protein
MISHQAVGEALKLEAVDYPVQLLEKVLAILVAIEKELSIATTRGYVVDPIRHENTERTRHVESLRSAADSEKSLDSEVPLPLQTSLDTLRCQTPVGVKARA